MIVLVSIHVSIVNALIRGYSSFFELLGKVTWLCMMHSCRDFLSLDLYCLGSKIEMDGVVGASMLGSIQG